MGLFDAFKKKKNTGKTDLDKMIAEAEAKKAKEDALFWQNESARALDKEGKIEEAITIYEKSIADGFDGSQPYDRLATIYHERKMFDDEIRVINAFLNIAAKNNWDNVKVNKFKDRLEKARNS